MGLYRRGKSKKWWMNFMSEGRQKCESTGTTDKRTAQKILDKRKGEIVEGRFSLPRSNPPALKQWAEQFLGSIQHQNTKRAYISCVRALLNFFGDARLSQISPGRIEEFKLARMRSGTRPATINRNLAVPRRMMKLAARQRLVGRSPFEEVDFLEERSGRRQPHILTFEEPVVRCRKSPLRG